jgi:hypothetical protein
MLAVWAKRARVFEGSPVNLGTATVGAEKGGPSRSMSRNTSYRELALDTATWFLPITIKKKGDWEAGSLICTQQGAAIVTIDAFQLPEPRLQEPKVT